MKFYSEESEKICRGNMADVLLMITELQMLFDLEDVELIGIITEKNTTNKGVDVDGAKL